MAKTYLGVDSGMPDMRPWPCLWLQVRIAASAAQVDLALGRFSGWQEVSLLHHSGSSSHHFTFAFTICIHLHYGAHKSYHGYHRSAQITGPGASSHCGKAWLSVHVASSIRLVWCIGRLYWIFSGRSRSYRLCLKRVLQLLNLNACSVVALACHACTCWHLV